MTFREVCVALDAEGTPFAWGEGSGGYIPDADGGMWSVVMEVAERRARLHAVAHTHPGSGVPQPSHIDLDSFAAAEKALGRPIVWHIVSADWTNRVTSTGLETARWTGATECQWPWIEELRARSWRTS